MSMPKKFGPQIRTRLLQKDAERFRSVARANYLTDSAMARVAILEYLENLDRSERNQVESVYAQAVKASTNRICAFLARMAADLRAVYCFVGEEDPELIKKWRAIALRQITEKLSNPESDLAKFIAQSVGGEEKPE